MHTLPTRQWIWLLVPTMAATTVWANDFPTAERVLYVQECMQTYPGPQFEMIQKCACAVDALAQQLSYSDYVSLSTLAKATTIAGERGGVIRESANTAPLIKRYRDIQSKANQACFIGSHDR